jgi:hypothetical protein
MNGVLSHSTYLEYLEPIFKNGIKKPRETGNSNWDWFFPTDRISFSCNPDLDLESENTYLSGWNNDINLVLDPKYISENKDEFKCYITKSEEVIDYANRQGMEVIDLEVPRFNFNEVVSFENIPVEGIHSLFLDSRFNTILSLETEEFQKIKSILPAHMGLYTKQTDDSFYRRIK